MRRQALATSHLSVFLEANPFREQDLQYVARRSVSLAVATADTGQLVAAAHRALGAIWRDGYRYKKAGVMLVDLVKAASVGDGLFDRRDDPRSLSRMRTLDALNVRFGRDTVTFGRTGARRPWLLSSEMLSRRYTTDWGELLAVQATSLKRRSVTSLHYRTRPHRNPSSSSHRLGLVYVLARKNQLVSGSFQRTVVDFQWHNSVVDSSSGVDRTHPQIAPCFLYRLVTPPVTRPLPVYR